MFKIDVNDIANYKDIDIEMVKFQNIKKNN